MITISNTTNDIRHVNLSPRLLSSVFFHSVHQVIVKGDEVADECSGAQAQTMSLW